MRSSYSRAAVDMICKATRNEYVLDKTIGALKSKKSSSSRKPKRKKGKTATNANGSSHTMSTRKKTKDLTTPL